MRRSRFQRQREPMITLINIIFLILIFFLISGILYQADNPGLRFIQTQGLECFVYPDALTISQSGQLLLAGKSLNSLDEYLKQLGEPNKTARLIPDQHLPASVLLTLIQRLKGEGVAKVIIITESQQDT